MSIPQQLSLSKMQDFYQNDTKKFLVALFGIIFILYVTIDLINTYVIPIYPVYRSIYAQGSADSIYFSNAVDALLHFKLPSNNYDAGLLALLIYIIPVGFSNVTHLDIGFSFRVFYLIVLLLTGYGIFLISEHIYSEKTCLKITLSFIFNPLIFLLSVWAGSEEIIEACLVIYIVYLCVTKHYNYAILLALISCFYKYYTILLLPIIILSMEDTRKKIYVSIILSTTFIFSGLLMFFYLNRYITNIFIVFIASFHLQGKGIFELLVEYGNIANINQDLGLLYYGLIGFMILLFYWCSKESNDYSKYSLVFLVFFILFPEFYSSYLIIPFTGVVLLYPKVSTHLQKINFLLLPVLSFLSEFSFNHVDSPYPLLNIQPTIFLRTMGVLALFGLYILMTSWLIIYFRYLKMNTKKEKEELLTETL